ncbi:cyclase family protein [Gemmatimonas phototrophica]|uniref:Cyclase n=1 Tax=Gemmatimonas phototrophica TaxID=1379270 RepID=A0A143BND7_9BACT|nr:cyclase family protein [Gemmatimonas phototrophica]AMW05971.1 cyclase [Gemmatimonas phototrophica]
MSHYVDLSHHIESGKVYYKGLPAPVICDYLSREASRALYADGTEFHIGRVELITNTGTYIDCPFHRYADGKDTASMALERFVDQPALVVDATARTGRAIGAELFAGLAVRGKAVLVHTGWSAHWQTDQYFEGHPYLTEQAACWLRDAGAVLVGIDSMNIDNTDGTTRPVHSVLLREEILIAEHLTNLSVLPREGFTFTAVPPKLVGVGTFPVRAFAKIG